MKTLLLGALLLAACGGSAGPGEVEMAVVGEDGGAVSPPPSEALEATCARWTRTTTSYGTTAVTTTVEACHAANADTCADGAPNYCFFASNDAGPNALTASCQEFAASEANSMIASPFCCCY